MMTKRKLFFMNIIITHKKNSGEKIHQILINLLSLQKEIPVVKLSHKIKKECFEYEKTFEKSGNNAYCILSG